MTANSKNNEGLVGDESQIGLVHGRTVDEVRDAIDQAIPNVLRMAVLQATGDPRLVDMALERVPVWGGAHYSTKLADCHVPEVRDAALKLLLDGPAEVPPEQQLDLRDLMGLLAGEPLNDFQYEIGRVDLVDDEFPLAPSWKKEPSNTQKENFRVAVIGAGLAGLTAGVHLQQLGIPFTIIDRNPEVGGTWWVNDYPEARVDIASHHYQLSFMRQYPWKSYYATQPELLAYTQEVARKFGLRERMKLSTSVEAAEWDEISSLWHLTLRRDDGKIERLTANAVISAAGLFNAPNLPDIEGIGSFQGGMFHTTQWNHEFDYARKNVALIGVGSTGAQVMPALARKVGHLTVYQRSPQWVSAIAGYHDGISDEVQWLFDHFPNYWRWYSFNSFSTSMGGEPDGLHSPDPLWQADGGLISARNDALRAHNIAYIHSKVGHRPELAARLTPSYPPFARRPVVDNGWFDALNRSNVDLVTEPIERVTNEGIIAGTERKHDLIVLGAGFKTERYLWPVAYRGRGGRTLEDEWQADGARAYLGITVPHFPNLFIVYGPNGQARRGGLIKWIEIWLRYSLSLIIEMIEKGYSSAEVRQEVFAAYNTQMDAEAANCLWFTPGARSYYINSHGRSSVNMPWIPADFYEWIREPNWNDFHLKR